MKIKSALLAAVSSACLLTGCMTEPIITPIAQNDHIILLNSNQNDVGLIDSQGIINDNGLLEITVKGITSRTSTFRWLFTCDPYIKAWYAIAWSDAKGDVYYENYHEMTFLPGTIFNIHEVAPAEKYIAYRILITLRPLSQKEITQTIEENKKLLAKKVAEKKLVPVAKPVVHNVMQVHKTGGSADTAAPKKAAAKKVTEPKQPAAKPAEQPVVKPVEQPVVKPAEQPVQQKVTEPKQPAAKPVEQKKLTESYL